eukprot:15462534-Alexandrium_andersonii.AAC.1
MRVAAPQPGRFSRLSPLLWAIDLEARMFPRSSDPANLSRAHPVPGQYRALCHSGFGRSGRGLCRRAAGEFSGARWRDSGG